uniref:Coiled-coil domain containing 88C n=1 Tax=Oncorhynchus kisutch TaxID=8019 RepID=A0A8C7HDZ9_ONCKI
WILPLSCLAEINLFLSSLSPPSLQVKTFGPLGSGSEDKLSMFMDLVDGVFLHKIMTHIDPSPTNQRVNKNVNNDVNLRIQNLNIVIRHVKNYYQDSLQQLILMTLPNVLTMAKDPLSGTVVLSLFFPNAQLCERKEEIIEKIKLLDIERQAAIVSHIQEVTQNQENVLDLQWLELPDMPTEELDPLSRNMALHLRKLIDERDECAEAIVELTQERDYLQSQQPSNHLGYPNPERTDLGLGGPICRLSKEDRQHLAVELADTKAKLRRSRQELEEKTEQLMDNKHEVERLDLEMQKLKQENMQLLAEARSVRAYRDEVDALREKAAKVDRLDTELSRCKERLHDVHFYKTRVEELREDNATLMETKTLLEEQLGASRRRCDKLHELEKENLQLRSKLHDVEMDRDTDKKHLEGLIEENMLLEISQKQSMNESAHLGWELEQLAKNNDDNDMHKSFVFELNESASSRLLKLEKVNQGLQSTIQELREASLSLEKDQLNTMELERENQGLSKKLERMQTLLDQEKQTTQDMEGLEEDLLKDEQKLEKTLERLQADKNRQISELEQEKEHLSQAVSSLHQHAQVDSEARFREVETENRVLHQTISNTGTKLARLEAQGKQATKELETLRERGEELERETTHLERSKEQLQREVASLKITCDRAEALERDNTSLEQDNRRLKKQVDTTQNVSLRLATLENDQSLLYEENLELRRTVESLRPAAVRLAQLQQENRELEREREDLTRSVEELRSQRNRAERLELSIGSLGQENQRLQQSLENSSTKIQGLVRELRQAETETGVLRRELEEVRLAGKRLEVVEKEKRGLEQELGQSEKERKQLEKEAQRLWQQLEVKEEVLEESALKLASLEKEGITKEKELERLKEVAGMVKELAIQNKELQKQATIDKRTLATLREACMGKSVPVERFRHLIEYIPRRIEAVLRGNSLGGLQLDIRKAFLTFCTLGVLSMYNLTHFPLSFQKATLQTEKHLLKDQLRQLDNQNSQLNAQNVALQGQAVALQQHNTFLHKQTAKLQVENSTLNCQSASLMAQNAVLQGQVGALESESEAWQRQREEAWVGREGVLQDHERLLSVHERQAAEYEQLITQHAALKGNQRALEKEHRALENKWQKDAMEAVESTLQKERESVREEIHKNALILGENQSLRGELDRLTQTHSQLCAEYDGLQVQTKELKTRLNRAQLEVNRWQARYNSMKEQHQGLDISMTKLDNHCELLTRLKGNLEEENHHLLSQIQMLSQQNQTLLERTMESKELYHEEQKQYIDKLNSLRRQKEKLEEKIMDQYKFYDPSPKKRNHWAGAKALAKLIKPKNRQDSSRERVRSTPDIPLPEPPTLDFPDIPPTPPLPLPPRQSCLSLDSVWNHSLEENHLGQGHFPALTPTPTYSSRGKTDRGDVYSSRVVLSLNNGSCPDSLEHLQDRSASLSSDDVVGLSHDVSHSLTLPWSAIVPYDTPVQRSAPRPGSHRTSSPGSEMVTLEEFLEESNTLSPPTVSIDTHICRSTLCRPSPLRDGAKTPTSYVTPTVKRDTDLHRAGEGPGRTYKPDQCVKPSVLLQEGSTSMPQSQSQTLPNQTSNGLGTGGWPLPLGPFAPYGGGLGSSSLSRTFSLASADLLRSNGPGSYRPDMEAGGSPSRGGGDGVVRRPGAGATARERPQSARLAGPLDIDPRRLSLAPPKEEPLNLAPPQHHSSSLSLQPKCYAGRTTPGSTPRNNSPSSGLQPQEQPTHQKNHCGEVAMLRAAPALTLEEPQEGDARLQADCPLLKKPEVGGGGGGLSCSTEEHPMSTSASPDPNNDPQTVWYEYGCV